MLSLLLVLAAAPKVPMADEWMTKAAKYPVGTKLEAKIESVPENGFGVFVELEPKILALVHKSDLPSDKTPADYRVGERLEVTVTAVDAAKHRISAKVEKTWEGALKYPPGHRARGKVESIAAQGLGVFVELSRDYLALAHKSDLPPGVAAESYLVGMEVEVQILAVDTERQRISAKILTRPAKGVER